MAEGVAEVQDRPAALFAFVLGDDLRLDFAASAHGVDEGLGLADQQVVQVALQPGEERRIGDHPDLHHFRQAGAELALRQRAQHADVRNDRARLMEGADEVLAGRMVDRGLAADGGIHQRQQRGGNLHQADAALVGGGGKASHVANHAAAERDHRGAAVVALGDQRIEDGGAGFQGLEAFAVADLQHVHLRRVQAALQRRQVGASDGGVADHQGLRCDELVEQAGARQQAVAEQDGIGASAGQLHLQAQKVARHAAHGVASASLLHSRSAMCAAMERAPLPSVSTSRWAASR